MHIFTDLSAHARRVRSFLAITAAGFLSLAWAAAQNSPSGSLPVYGPRICVEARYWNTPGWQSRSGDYAYMQVVPGRTSSAQIRQGLGRIPEASRMLRSAPTAEMDKLLRQLIETDRFKLAALGYDFQDSTAAVISCQHGQELAHKFGLAFFVTATQKAAEQLAGCSDLLMLADSATAGSSASTVIEEQRKLYQKLLAANPKLAIFQNVAVAPDGRTVAPHGPLRYYQGSADLVQGILLNAGSAPAHLPRLLRAVRPKLGQPHAVAPDEGPSMYFFTFNWQMPGWQPRKGDYAVAKIRPTLKTYEQKLAYVLDDLKDIAPENRMLQFNSLEGADELLKDVIETRHFPIACLAYDLENWELSSAQEKADPLSACRSGQALANKYGMDFIVMPDMGMSKKWGSRVVPLVNAFKPQCKGIQAKSIDEAIVYQRKLYIELRRANPDVRIFHDVGISPKGKLQTVEGLLRYYAGVADLVDGIGVFSVNTPEQNAVIEKYIVGVRPPVVSGVGVAAQKRRIP